MTRQRSSGQRARDSEGTDMEAGARAWDSCLLDKDTFLENFHLEWWPNKAYLCYETELPSGDPGVPLGQHKDILCNKQMTQPFPASSVLSLPGEVSWAATRSCAGCSGSRPGSCFLSWRTDT
ncbi:uncharacterized protein LOC144616865 [Panthera onca]